MENAAVGTQIAVVKCRDKNSDMFWLGEGGSVRAFYWDPDTRSPVLYELAPLGSAVDGPIEVVARVEGKMSAWWISADGSIYYAYWVSPPGWQRY